MNNPWSPTGITRKQIYEPEDKLETDRDIVYTALSMLKNKRETGSADYSAQDLQNMNETCYDGARIRALDTNQMRTIVRIKELMDHILNTWK